MGRFCLNCGHRIGAPVPPDPTPEYVVATVPEATPARKAAPKPARKPVRDPAPTPEQVRPERTWDPDEDLLPFDDAPSSTGRR